MKKLLGSLFFALIIFVSFARCNDDGTGEGTDPKSKVLIDNDVKPLNKRYAAVGIAAWVLVSAIGIIGHKRVGKTSKTF